MARTTVAVLALASLAHGLQVGGAGSLSMRHASRAAASLPTMGVRKKPSKPERYVPEGRVLRGGLPEEVFARTNFATGGERTPETVGEIEQNWKAFKTCFASERLAIEAAKKNSAVFSPQFSSPTKIKGTYKLLCKRLGKQQTAELLMKNPGVLCNSPAGLEKCTDKEIIDAADLGTHAASATATRLCPQPLTLAMRCPRAVATLDANKPVINALAGLVLILVLAAGLYRGTVVNPTGAIAGFDESGKPLMRRGRVVGS